MVCLLLTCWAWVCCCWAAAACLRGCACRGSASARGSAARRGRRVCWHAASSCWTTSSTWSFCGGPRHSGSEDNKGVNNISRKLWFWTQQQLVGNLGECWPPRWRPCRSGQIIVWSLCKIYREYTQGDTLEAIIGVVNPFMAIRSSTERSRNNE